MKLEVLLSCMNQTDTSIVGKSNITGDVLVINQAAQNSSMEIHNGSQCIRMLTTTERGLSHSRNMAIQNAAGDICLLSDDDELFEVDYESIIINTFSLLPTADIIAFDINNKSTRLKKKTQKINQLSSLKLSSCQLSFRRKSILQSKLAFDPYMGAGSENGCGEENKFLLDCLRAGLTIYYVPIIIATLNAEYSTWFSGFDEHFFYQRGGSTRYMLGLIPSVIYGIYYLIAKRSLYKNTIVPTTAAIALFKGIKDNTIYHQKYKVKHG